LVRGAGAPFTAIGAATLGDRFADGSQDLLGQAEGACGFNQYPCLWGRAILPAELFDFGQFKEGAEDAVLYESPGFADTVKATGEFYPDGSGGADSAPHLEKHHGSGVAAVTFGNTASEAQLRVDGVAVIAAKVPGWQSVPRAELWGATLGVRSAPLGSKVVAHPDATCVHKALAAKRLVPGKSGINQKKN